MAWNIIDFLLILIVLLNLLFGWQRGLIIGTLDLLRWIGSILIGLRFYQPIARLIGMRADWPGVWDQPIAFLLTVTGAGILIYLIEKQILKRIPAGIHQKRLNRLLGLVPGFITGLTIAAVASPLLLALPLPDGLRTTTRDSVVADRLTLITNRVEAALAPVFDEAIKRTLNLRTIAPESDRTLNLPYKITNSKPRPDLEARMLELVNRERRAAGLDVLQADPALTEVARRHSTDMLARGYFSHLTPEGRTPFDRIRSAGIRFLTAGENLALAPTLTIAHNGLMNSPGHRANILRPEFGGIGIGIMDGGRPGLMVTQNFRN